MKILNNPDNCLIMVMISTVPVRQQMLVGTYM